MMQIRLLLCAAACLSFWSVAVASSPNVIVILTDDQGWGDLSMNGNPNIDTPNIDSIAKNGATLQNFYVCAVCSPTRAEFLTGRYHTRMGVFSTSQGGERFDADETTIADVFKANGYRTAAYGKWHSGMQAPYHPNSRGFDDYYGFCSGHWGDYYSPMLEHNGELVQGNGFLVDDLTDHAIDFIKAEQDQPFFIYLPLNTPHSPMQAPQKYWDEFKEKPIVSDPDETNTKKENKDFTRAALAMCKNIDDNVGRVIRALDDEGIAEETIVVYFSDNGPNSSRFNGGMRGRKGSVYEGGLRSPCVMKYPAKVPAGLKVPDVTAAIDLLPTLAQLAECSLPTSVKPIDGQSFATKLTPSRQSSNGSRLVFSAWNQKYSVRSQTFRYHANGTLYHINSDRGEEEDVSDEHPDAVANLKSALDAWITETSPKSSRHQDPRPFPLGHPDLALTQLPARDAVATGKIQRSNRWPNCSFFQAWSDTKDTIQWDVDVVEGGDYHVELRYACKASSVGTALRLSAGDSSTTTTVTTANDVPLIGADDDLIPRQEGYVKAWKSMSLGTLSLEAGPQRIELRAVEIPGGESVDVRLLMFSR